MNLDLILLFIQQTAETPAVTLNLIEAVLAIFGLTTGAVAILGMVATRPTRQEMTQAIMTGIGPLKDDLEYIRKRLDEHTSEHTS